MVASFLFAFFLRKSIYEPTMKISFISFFIAYA